MISAVELGAPREAELGKARGYPIGTAQNWLTDPSVRVGSFTHQGEIPGIFNGEPNVLAASASPLPLRRTNEEPLIHWQVDHRKGLTVDDYLARHPIMGLMIVEDGEIQVERYQYDRDASHRFVSMSMAQSITALGIGIALRERKIAWLDDRAVRYAPKLADTLYGEVTIRNLLRMASGARCADPYENEDGACYECAVDRDGIEAAAKVMSERAAPQGTGFRHASADTDVLAAVLRGATGMSLSQYLTPRLWQAIGAETSALWRADRTGLERASGNFNATLSDFARLGIVLTNHGVRPGTRPQAARSAGLSAGCNGLASSSAAVAPRRGGTRQSNGVRLSVLAVIE